MSPFTNNPWKLFKKITASDKLQQARALSLCGVVSPPASWSHFPARVNRPLRKLAGPQRGRGLAQTQGTLPHPKIFNQASAARLIQIKRARER
jgi:hypothetical protein